MLKILIQLLNNMNKQFDDINNQIAEMKQIFKMLKMKLNKYQK